MPRAEPLPARALRERLYSAVETPCWASYLKLTARKLEVGECDSASHLCKTGYMQPLHQPCADALEDDAASGLRTIVLPHARTENVTNVRGRIWQLSQEPHGSRYVQRVLEKASDMELEQLAAEFEGHVLEAAKSPHANFVLQKCVDPRAPIALRIIARELISQGSESTILIARHRYGCRVVERILEHCELIEANDLSDLIIADARNLCMHPYGNYTMQHLLSHGPLQHRQKLIALLQDNAVEMGSSFYASAVLGEALKQASYQDAEVLSKALFQTDGLIAHMSRTKHGHSAAIRALQVMQSRADVSQKRIASNHRGA